MDTESITASRLNALPRILAAHIDALNVPDAVEAEGDVADMFDAIRTAILLEQTGELAAIVRQWMNGKIMRVAQAADDRMIDSAVGDLREGLHNQRRHWYEITGQGLEEEG